MSEILYLEDLEDLEVGVVRSFGRYRVTQEEIIEFARDLDDQSFHTDPEAAKDSIFGGLIASGWHTGAMMMRMVVDHGRETRRVAVLASPGFDDLEWLLPVRPGDVLSARTELLEVIPSRSKPDRGSIKGRMEVLNQNGDVVLRMISLAVVARRPKV